MAETHKTPCLYVYNEEGVTVFTRIIDMFAKRRARRKEEGQERERKRQKTARAEEQKRQRRDLEWAMRKALMQKSRQCFETTADFFCELEIEGINIQLTSTGNPWTRQRVTKVRAMSPDMQSPLSEVYTHNAERKQQ